MWISLKLGIFDLSPLPWLVWYDQYVDFLKNVSTNKGFLQITHIPFCDPDPLLNYLPLKDSFLPSDIIFILVWNSTSLRYSLS